MHYSFYKETKLLHIHQLPKPLLCVRLIDDALVMVRHINDNCHTFHKKMNLFKDSTQQGLDWEAESLTKQVNFLDLTLTLNSNNLIETKTYQKSMNLYLCRPPHQTNPKTCCKA